MSTQDFTPASLFDLSGRIALVTGGGTGIGLMQAQGLAAAGATVYILGRRKEVLERSAEAHSLKGGAKLVPIVGDVTSKDSIKKVADEIERLEGHLDILFANAGTAGPTHPGADTSAPDEQGDPESADPHKNPKLARPAKEYSKQVLDAQDFSDWSSLFDINTSSAFFLFATFLPLLDAGSKAAKKAGKSYTSTFITTGSISGLVKQSQMHFAYNASKAAVNHLTRAMAFEVTSSTDSAVRVNALLPGVFPSEMTAGSSDDKNKSDLSEKLPTMAIPAGRPGTTSDMASAAVFLAACEYVHGICLPVDGGFVLSEP